MSINLIQLRERLRTIESLALISSVSSTNEIARRVVGECIENEISLPRAVIIAREQRAGRGRSARGWYSPRDKGIYSSVLFARGKDEIGLLPLEMATVVARFLRDVYAIQARIKWPNDTVVDGRKIAGILIEARTRDDESFLVIGIGINIERLDAGAPPDAISVADLRGDGGVTLDSATEAFVEFLDGELTRRPSNDEILDSWRSLTIHERGDRIACTVGARQIEGKWVGVDDFGRAIIDHDGEPVYVSGGDIIAAETP